MCHPDYDLAINYAIECLREQLSPKLTYHNLWHTQSDVMPAVSRLGALVNLADSEIRLMEVAAAFHDIGFLKTHRGHEAVGVEMARKALPDFGFDERQIGQIEGMILATQLPQTPRNLLERVVVDADLDVLGRDDFFARSALLHKELKLFGQRTSWREWMQVQLRFLEQHTYFTPEARALRNEGKQRHIDTIEEWLRRGYGENGRGD